MRREPWDPWDLGSLGRGLAPSGAAFGASYGAAFGAAAAGEVGWHAVGAGGGASGVFGARVRRAAALPPLPRWQIQPPAVTALR